ncbi:hypothetical protein [Moorena sp. SIO4A5]|uniref:hypothetical protein n=1 Tax=Moorena sp. SIO4A5 TaxID=2607838 RepID=UPI0025D39DD0|nr:hypothetical protein [Moorena sp. SIO4A5]
MISNPCQHRAVGDAQVKSWDDSRGFGFNDKACGNGHICKCDTDIRLFLRDALRVGRLVYGLQIKVHQGIQQPPQLGHTDGLTIW